MDDFLFFENPNLKSKLTAQYSLIESYVNGDLNFSLVTKNEDLLFIIDLFQQQLPSMPSDYILEQVVDPLNSVFILRKKEGEILCTLLTRVFKEQQFIELIFLATVPEHRNMRYGHLIIGCLKEYMKSIFNTSYIISYADVTAIGFFKKVGFTTEMRNSSWIGYIKDYVGGILVESQIFNEIDYINWPKQVLEKKKSLDSEILESGCIRQLEPGEKIYDKELDDIPYMEKLNNGLLYILSYLMELDISWPFRKPVSVEEAPDYYRIIDTPMDLTTMSKKQYTSIHAFRCDFNIIIDNCKKYNGSDVSNLYTGKAVQLLQICNEKCEEISKSLNMFK